MSLQQIINQIPPRKLFLVDSIGALVSAFMLGVVLVKLEPIFGMPAKVLYLFTSIACLFFIYSFYCFLRFPKNWRPYLKAIAIANLLYCCLTLFWVIYLYPQLTILGVVYFIVEIIIVVTLSVIELKTAASLSKK